jgi:S1-C subfamily serine protease
MPDVASVVKRVGSSVVQVLATTSTGTRQGSGVIFSDRGYVLTNNHVVEETVNVQVALPNRRVVNAAVAGTDPETDLAVLQLAKSDIAGLAVATLGDSEAMSTGDWVIAIGSPLGYEGSVTVGVISATGRFIDIGDVVLHDMIQTDTVINPGSSGGPLLNLDGDVIGINTAIVRGTIGSNQDAVGIGFSISMGTAIPVSKQLIQRGSVLRPKLGILIVNVTPLTAASLGLSIDDGVLIQSVVTGGPAQRAGLRANDVITHLNGLPVLTTSDLMRKILTDYQIDDLVTLTVARGVTAMTIYVHLES